MTQRSAKTRVVRRQEKRRGHSARAIILAATGVAAGLLSATRARAQDSSAPAILQWFEGTYRTMENRTADLFQAGYGAVWMPPPGRADSGDWSVGYDVYDRFDLGKPGRPTTYGTETGIKTLANTFHRAGVDMHIDLILNHNGFSDAGTPGFIEAGGYPGFVLQDPDGGHDPYGVPYTDGDFNSAYDYGDQAGRLAGLIDINHGTNWQFIRNPVDPGDSRNIPAGWTAAYGRLANQPDPDNARFYPDLQSSPIMVMDPRTGETDIPIYSFNLDNPLAGDAVPENATGLLMRYSQWMVQAIGADGFRIDAAKHIAGFELNYFDRAVYRSNPRLLLDGTTKHVFSYGEVYDSNRDKLLRGPDWDGANLPDDDFVRKDIVAEDIGRIGGNRDVLDFAMRDALANNLTGNGFANNWHNVVNAGLDTYDDGKHNGSVGVLFVGSHDMGGGPAMNSVAHAYMLMQPGNAVVYFNGKEHGDDRPFPKDGRGDALGGMYGNALTTLTNLRVTHGRGNYKERWIEDNQLAFERENSALVLLSNRNDGGYDTRRMDVGFDWNTTLVELTGNASANADIPELITVDNDVPFGQNKVTVRFLRNDAQDKGYLIYGLATPRSSNGLELSNVAQTLPGGDPNVGGGSANYRNGTTRLADVKVIQADSFQIALNTQAVTLVGRRLENDQLVQRSIRDRSADGDNALIKIDGGLDLNDSGQVDFIAPGSVAYGFEQFTTSTPGYFQGDGNGHYSISVDAAALSEGYHYIESRAFRQRSDGGPAVFSSFKQTIYVDRLKPVSAYDSNAPVTIDGVTQYENRDFIFRSMDQTADNMHVFLDLPANLSDASVLGMVGSGSQSDYWDRDLFKKYFSGLSRGNHAFTIVTYEITGTYNVQRFGGVWTQSPIGAGLGDVTSFTPGLPDGYIEGNDLDAIHSAVKSNNALFYAPADFNADGLMSLADWMLLGSELTGLHEQNLLNPGGGALVSQGTLDYYHFLSLSVPEPGALALLAGLLPMLLRRRQRHHWGTSSCLSASSLSRGAS